MNLFVKQNDNGMYEVVQFGTNSKYGEYHTKDEAEEEIVILELANGNPPVKSLVSENLTIEELDDNIEVSGYLLRYTNPQKPDLTKQWWSKSTYLMREAGFPIVGAPIKMAHSLEQDFTRIGIGIVNFVTEDELGVFIKGQLYKRDKWKKIVEEAAKRRGHNLSTKQIDELASIAYTNIKTVVKSMPLQWSMGSYPPTFKVDKSTGHIETAGIVEATLTPIPAEPYGTEVNVAIKNFTESLSFIEPSANKTTETTDDDFYNSLKFIINNDTYKKQYKKGNKNKMSSNETKRRETMLKAVSDVAVKLAQMALPAIEDEEEVEEGEEKQAPDKEQMKSYLEDAITKIVEKDTGFKNAETDEEISKVVKSIVDDNMADFVKSAVGNYIETRREEENNIKQTVKNVFNEQRETAKEAAKSTKVAGYQKQITPEEAMKQGYVKVTKEEEGSLADFFKQVAMGIAPKTEDYTKSMKSQNPYIGTLGGFLVGHEVSQTILDPLRAKVVMFDAGVTQTNVNGIGSYTVNKMTTAPSAYRPGINQTITESQATFDSITAFLRPLAARVVIPRQLLLTTGTNVEQKIRDEVIRSLRLHIDEEILQGVGAVSGTGNTGAEIRGVKRVLNASPVSSTNVISLDTNGRKPKYDDLINAETQIAVGNVEFDQSTMAWVMHPRDRGTFRRTTDATGQPLLYSNYSEKPYEDLIGYKVLTTTQIDKAQTVGSSTDCSDIYFGNWRYGEYVIGQDIEVIRDDMTLADALNVRFIVYMYSDFIVHYPEAFYIMSGVRG